jgi:hypothetical protein
MLRDAEALASAHACLFSDDPTMRRHRARILSAQDYLRSLVDKRAWQAYLRTEAASVARFVYALDAVSAWAFRQGRRTK